MNTATLHRRQPCELSALALVIALASGCASTRPGAAAAGQKGATGAAKGALGGAVVALTAGAISGGWNGMPSDQVAALHRPVESARRERGIQEVMVKRVLQESAALPHYQLTYLADAGPASATDSPDYPRVKADGYDAMLELSVASVGFQAAKGEPPLVHELQHRGQWRAVPQWAADDGRLLEEELAASYASLIAQLSQAVFWPVSAE